MAKTRQRRQPNKAIMYKLLVEQDCRCAYCNVSLDEVEIEWDHFLPYGWIRSNPADNWVAACRACNRAKSDRYFASEADLSDFCLEMVSQHGSWGDGVPEGVSAAFLLKRF